MFSLSRLLSKVIETTDDGTVTCNKVYLTSDCMIWTKMLFCFCSMNFLCVAVYSDPVFPVSSVFAHACKWHCLLSLFAIKTTPMPFWLSIPLCTGTIMYFLEAHNLTHPYSQYYGVRALILVDCLSKTRWFIIMIIIMMIIIIISVI